MEPITELLKLLDTLSPLAVIALLGVIILLLVRGKQQVTSIKSNDLHHLGEMSEILQRIEVILAKEFSWIRAKLDGSE